jgi:hypothetical protein
MGKVSLGRAKHWRGEGIIYFLSLARKNLVALFLIPMMVLNRSSNPRDVSLKALFPVPRPLDDYNPFNRDLNSAFRRPIFADTVPYRTEEKAKSNCD